MSETEEILANLNSDDLAIKKKNIFQAGEKKISESIPILISLLKSDEDSVVRNSAARSLGKINDASQFDDVLEALDEALTDSDPYVKSNACWSLGKLKNPMAIPSLMKMVDPSQRRYSMGGDPNNADIIDETAASEKIKEEGIKFSDIIVSAIKAIGEIKVPEGIPALVKALNDESDGAVRCAAALALGKIGDNSAVPHLIKLLKIDKYWYVRRDIAKALVKLKDPRAAPELLRKTSDMYDEVREYSMKALIAIGKPIAKTLFQLFIQNPKNPKLKKFISQELNRAEINQILTELLKEEKIDSKKLMYQRFYDEFNKDFEPEVETEMNPEVEAEVKPEVETEVKPEVETEIENIKETIPKPVSVKKTSNKKSSAKKKKTTKKSKSKKSTS